MGNAGIYSARKWFWLTGQTQLGVADVLHPIGVLDEDDTIAIYAIPTFYEGVEFDLGDGEQILINATDASGGLVEPFIYTSNLPVAGTTGGRALFLALPTAQLGSYANALKGYLDFAVTAQAGGLAGMGSAVCAELRLPNGAVTGHLFPLEVEWVGQTNTAFGAVGTGAASGFMWLKANGTVTDFDSDGVFMTVQGLTAGSGKLLAADSHSLRCDLGYGTLKYLILSDAEDSISFAYTEDITAAVAVTVTVGDTVTAGMSMSGAGVYTAGIILNPTGIMVDGLLISGTTPVDGIHISSASSANAVNISGANTGNAVTISGATTDTALEISGTATNFAIDISGAQTAVGLSIAGLCGTHAINIGAQTGAGITMLTAGTYGLNLSGDCTTGINIAAQGTMGIALAVAAAVGGMAIDAGTINHAADGNIFDINLDVEGAYSVNAINVNIDFDTTGMGAADTCAAFNADINELLLHTDGAVLYGTNVTLTAFDTGECDLLGHLVTIDGTKTTDESMAGFKVVSTMTTEHSGSFLYGNYIDFSGITHTDGSVYGQYIDLSYANTAANCWGTFYLMSNYGTAISIDAGTTAIDTAADLIFVDLGVNSCSVNVMNVHIDVDTALTTGEDVRGLNIDINGNAGDHGDSSMAGIYLTSANTTTGVNTAIEIAGTWDAGIHFAGGVSYNPIHVGEKSNSADAGLILVGATDDTGGVMVFADDGGDALGSITSPVWTRYLITASQSAGATATGMFAQVKSLTGLTFATGSYTAFKAYNQIGGTLVLNGANTEVGIINAGMTHEGDCTVTNGTLSGIDVNVDDNAHTIGTSSALLVRKVAASTLGWTYGLNIGDAGAATGVNIGTCTTGIHFGGTVTEAIDFADATFSPDSTRTNYAIGVGDRNDELGILFGNANNQNFDPVQMNFNLTCTSTGPTNASAFNGIYQQITHDTTDMEFLRLKGCDWTITTDKVCQDAYVVQTELIVSGTKVSSGELMAVSALTTLGSGARTADRVCALQAMLSGSGTAGTVTGDAFAAYLVNAGTVITTDAICKVFNQSAATSVDGLNVENDGTVTSLVQLDNDGTATNAFKVDGTMNYLFDFDDAATCVVATTGTAATTSSAQILVKTPAGATGYINVYSNTGS